MELDQYYTKSGIAQWCIDTLFHDLPLVADKHFIEPSAGNGSFYSLLPINHRTGLDIDPHGKGIKQADFLKWQLSYNCGGNVVIGNPPFGHRSSTAISFFNHAADMADTVAFIVPRQFQKYSVQSHLNKDFRLISDYELGEKSFYTPNGKDFGVRCVFQIWTRQNTEHQNLRLLVPPPIKHPDFEMYQYNNTRQALKVFNYDWDFAVPRQGFENYNRREKEGACCEKNKQWILFKAKTNQIFDRLWNFNFENLARKNTIIYGFGKADVVMEYNKCFYD